MVISLTEFISIIDAEECSGEGGDLTKADEERVMDLSEGFDINSAEKHDQSA